MILVAGENLVDLIQTDPASPRFEAVPGGSPYNCARALARLGVPVGYLTPISTDPMGDLLAEGLRAEGARLLGGRSARPTALALVTLENGRPRYRFYREGTADRAVTPAGMRRAMPAEATALHVGSMALRDRLDAEALAGVFVDVAAQGLVTSVDPNIRPAGLRRDAAARYRARLARVMAAARIIRLCDEDLAWWAPGATLAEAAGSMQAAFRPALLVVTRGAAGAVAWHAGGVVEAAAAPVPVLVDTVGAGDNYMAGLLASLHEAGALSPPGLAALDANGLRRHLGRAARAAALTCGRQGCDPPTRAELDAAG